MKAKLLAVILVICSVLTGCQKEDEKKTEQIKIGVVLYNQYDTFISSMMEEFLKYVDDKEKETGVVINVEIYDAEDDQTTQNNRIETMINNGCDVICVNLVDRTAPTYIIDMAKNAKVPVVFFNRELVEEDLARWGKLYYIGADASESGRMQGEMIVTHYLENKEMDKNGDGSLQYVVLEGEAGHQDAILRTESCIEAMEEAGVSVDKLGYAIANWNRAQAQTKMSHLMEEYPGEIELVISNNDDMALGVIDALKEAEVKKADWPVIMGIDGTDVGLEAVKKREMTGTVYNDKEGQALAMIELAYALARGEKFSAFSLTDGKYIRLPYEKVWVEDVERYLQK